MAKVLTTSLSFWPAACPNSDQGCIAAHSALRHNTAYRTGLLGTLISHAVQADADILLTPAGFFASTGPADLPAIVATVRGLLTAAGAQNLCVAVGVDGNTDAAEMYSPDQFMLAITAAGVIGGARKASPAPGEEAYIPVGNPWAHLTVGAQNVNRVFVHAGRRFSLAVCYDGLAPSPQQLGWNRPPGLQAVLNGVHWFYRKKIDRPSGDFYFARGLASASAAWEVPVFASASFICRWVVEGFPNGVTGHPWPAAKGPKDWSYNDNRISPVGDDVWPNDYVRLRAFEV